MTIKKMQPSAKVKAAISKMRGPKIDKDALTRERIESEKKRMDAIMRETDLATDFPLPA